LIIYFPLSEVGLHFNTCHSIFRKATCCCALHDGNYSSEETSMASAILPAYVKRIDALADPGLSFMSSCRFMNKMSSCSDAIDKPK
jgi:hypothetical protein